MYCSSISYAVRGAAGELPGGGGAAGGDVAVGGGGDVAVGGGVDELAEVVPGVVKMVATKRRVTMRWRWCLAMVGVRLGYFTER